MGVFAELPDTSEANKTTSSITHSSATASLDFAWQAVNRRASSVAFAPMRNGVLHGAFSPISLLTDEPEKLSIVTVEN